MRGSTTWVESKVPRPDDMVVISQPLLKAATKLAVVPEE